MENGLHITMGAYTGMARTAAAQRATVDDMEALNLMVSRIHRVADVLESRLSLF